MSNTKSSRNRNHVAGRNRRSVKLFLSVFTVFCLSFILFSSLSSAHESNDKIMDLDKYYTSMEVEYGDTLWSIAEDYAEEYNLVFEDCLDEICKINGITQENRDILIEGSFITVPFYK